MQRGDDHARLVQDDVAKADAVGKRDARKHQRPLQVEDGVGPRESGKLADRHHLGQHHRRRLQRLEFFLVVGAVRRVLDDEHAKRAARTQDRHAEERVVNLFAGFRQVLEGRVLLRVAEVQRQRILGDRADEALADA